MTQLIVALDDDRAVEALSELIEAGARWFKVDPWLLMDWDASSRALGTIADTGCDLFLDLKLYQPLATTERTARRAWDIGAKLLTVFADSKLLRAASECRTDIDQQVIAVGQMTDGTGSLRDVSHTVQYGDAQGVICRPGAIAEYSWLNNVERPTFVCPGIRTQEAWSAGGHHAIFSPGEAARLGADYVVVGRPIYESPDPAAAIRSILKELADAQT